ncbi:hypothetical protein ANCCEY_02547 [Ancylostoma ceylanicum]|uniref:Transmembrane protein 135 N-terminal domain-containing protein n=1 Tax=Ancylostoma ceylanicum TaxID=53326 RepID=A0A0D6M4J1_9BILA|nr:hypothetical protein ANCCEY_02547 [Ancylostoma ceylanicum]
MAFLSKLAYALNMQVLTTNCYETIHTWEPDCYKAILASETLYRQLYNHGYLFNVKFGECIPFAVGVGLFMLLRARGKLQPSMEKVLNFSHSVTPNTDILDLKKVPDDFHALLHKLRYDFGRTASCEHKYSCASVAVESFVKNFAVGTGISAVLTLLGNLRKLLTNPLMISKILFSSNNLKLPLFSGLMPFLFHVTRCLLNRSRRCNTVVNNTVAGMVSAASMTAYPSVTIAMYTMWKGIEESEGATVMLGKISVYTRRNGKSNRIKVFNRDLYEHFGFQSKLLYPNARPVLDTKYVTLNPMLYQKIMPPS